MSNVLNRFILKDTGGFKDGAVVHLVVEAEDEDDGLHFYLQTGGAKSRIAFAPGITPWNEHPFNILVSDTAEIFIDDNDGEPLVDGEPFGIS